MRNRTFKKRDYDSGDGMLTSVWGPGMWHFLHTTSFNYPVSPTPQDKLHYRNFILSLQHILPCKYCRMNLHNNFKTFPLQICHMKNRESFSRYVYRLHEIVNKMLGKSSKLSYCDVRERYEHFRSRCTVDDKDQHQQPEPIPNLSRGKGTTRDNYKVFNFGIFKNKNKTKNKTAKRGKGKEKGCTEPLHGQKSKCIIKIVPQDEKQPTFTMDDKCIKKRVDE